MKKLGRVKNRFSVIGEIFHFLWARKLWWLIPLVAMLILIAFLIILAQAGAAPFIYTLF